jgi:hypothetical protein
VRLQEFDDEVIMEIAAEDPSIRHLRADLKSQRRTLEAGERICRKYTARRDLSLDFAPATDKKAKSSARPYNPSGNPAPRQRKPIVAATAAEPRTSYEEATSSPRAAYQREPAPPSVQRTPSRATVDSTISNPGAGDQYMPPPGYNASRQNNRQSYVPTEYQNGGGEYYEAPQQLPPRPPPTIPPKQPEAPATPGDEGFKSRQAMRSLFAGRK